MSHFLRGLLQRRQGLGPVRRAGSAQGWKLAVSPSQSRAHSGEATQQVDPTVRAAGGSRERSEREMAEGSKPRVPMLTGNLPQVGLVDTA